MTDDYYLQLTYLKPYPDRRKILYLGDGAMKTLFRFNSAKRVDFLPLIDWIKTNLDFVQKYFKIEEIKKVTKIQRKVLSEPSEDTK